MSTTAGHSPPHGGRSGRRPRRRKEFCPLGPVAEAFITGTAAAGNNRLGPELAEPGALCAAHGDDAFLAALDRAMEFGR